MTRIGMRVLPPKVTAPAEPPPFVPRPRASTPPSPAPPTSFTPGAPIPPLHLPGLEALPPELQAKVKRLHEGHSLLANRFRMAERQLLSQADYRAATPAEQGQFLVGALDAALLTAVQPERQQQARAAAPWALGPPRLDAAFPFPGGPGRAEVFELVIDGQRVRLAAPADRRFDPPQQHTVEEVARALAGLPESSRTRITSVTLSPVANPDDAFWAKTYGLPEMTSHMSVGTDGAVTVYPSTRARTAEHLAMSLLHESGHAWSFERWGTDTTAPAWKPWADAVEADVVRVSTYGNAHLSEDVAEATALYQSIRGTPLFEEYRALYPARFAILDRELGGTAP